MIPMQHNFEGLTFRLGNEATLDAARTAQPVRPFAPETLALLQRFSHILMSDSRSRGWSDVISLAFWCRKASLEQIKNQHTLPGYLLGRGIAFHIAPSNVAVNFAYSLIAGLLTGNANIVRLPSKHFAQVDIICEALSKTLQEFPLQAHRIVLVEYGHQKHLTDYFSACCDARLIWGGDETIARIRASKLRPRAVDIAFADRYSLAVINAATWLQAENPARILEDFYNDTLLTEQQACTAAKLVVWLGSPEDIRAARDSFWAGFTAWIADKYSLVAANAVKNLARFCQDAANNPQVRRVGEGNNLIFRIEVSALTADMLIDHHHSGYFYEYLAHSLDDISPVCGEKCQTMTTLGILPDEINRFLANIQPRGVDRIVPFGQSMQFSLVWDGYALVSELTRNIQLVNG